MTERDLFIAALQKEDAGQRREYLREACGPNPALLERVEGLLQVYEDADSFLESPAPAPTLTVESPEPARRARARSSAPTSCWSRSARAAWASSTWPSRPSPCAARWR